MSLIQLQTLLVLAFVFHQNHGSATLENNSVDTHNIESKPKAIPKQFRVSVSSDYGRYVIVTFAWESIQREDFNGNGEAYNIHYWNASNPKISYEHIREHSSAASSNELKIQMPVNTLYYATIQAVNEKYFGPPSNIIEFRMPEILPEQIRRTAAIPLGSTAFKLKWDAPEDLNGQILGYNIYYSEIDGRASEQRKIIHDSRITETKIVELKPSTTYQFHIAAWSKAGEAEDFPFKLTTIAPAKPAKPSFTWEPQNKTNGYNGYIQVNLKPQMYNGKPGSTFYVKYHIKNSAEWKRTPGIIIDDYANIHLETYETYEVSIVSVDGVYETESDVQIVSKKMFEGTEDSPSMWLLGVVIVGCSAVVVVGLLWLLNICGKKSRSRNSV